MERIVVVGTTGSGKSTLAEQIARQIDAEYVDLDALFWQADWQGAPDDLFRARVTQALACGRWAISGNYSRLRDLTWARADTLIWLDYSLALVFSRLFRRTVRRIVTQEDLWGTGNRESWRKQFLSRESLFLWMLQTHRKNRAKIAEGLQQPEYAHLQVMRFRSPRVADRWLATI